MRIATGGVLHETSTFLPSQTTVADFEQGFGIYRGTQIFDRFRGANMCPGGFIEGAEKHGFELVPLIWGFAYPSGVIRRADYEQLKTEFFTRLQEHEAAHGPVDGLLLDLHGAMVVEGIDDGDGDMLAAARAAMGDRPVIVTFDLHGNHTVRRTQSATAIVGYDTYPHVDMAERGREAADLMVRCVRGEVKPVMAIRQFPMFWSAQCQATSHPPMDEVLRRVHELETRPGILSVTISTGFPWADVPDMGASLIAVADGNRALAEAAVNEVGDWIWSSRARWYQAPPSVREGLATGEKLGKYPIMIADFDDNTGGGAPGDSTEVLRTFLDMKLENALVLYMVDLEAVALAHQAGQGKRLRLKLGGKSHPAQGEPVDVEAEVVALTDGKFKYDGPMYAGLTGNMGPSAWLRIGGTSVVVVSKREQPLDPAFARSLGIDCAGMKYISVKSAVHFRSGFEKIAGSIHNVDAQALHSHRFEKLKFTKRRKMYPIDLD
jgi:microcystin degradation protein MlrC